MAFKMWDPERGQWVEAGSSHPSEIDTCQGIQKSLRSLAAFYALLKVRHNSEDELGARLVLGRYLLHGCVEYRIMDGGQPVVIPNVPEVLSVHPKLSEFLGNLRRLHGDGIHVDAWLPPELQEVCPGCGKGWNLLSAHDCEHLPEERAVKLMAGAGNYHWKCLQKLKPSRKFAELRDEIDRARPTHRFISPIDLNVLELRVFSDDISRAIDKTENSLDLDTRRAVRSALIQLNSAINRYEAMQKQWNARTGYSSREAISLQVFDEDYSVMAKRCKAVSGALSDLRAALDACVSKIDSL